MARGDEAMATIRHLQRLMDREPGALASAIGVIIAVGAPTALRLGLRSVLGDTLWFSTYYPAVLIAALLLGWRVGLIVLLLGGLAGDYFFIPPPMTFSLEKRDVAALLVYLLAAGLILVTAAFLRSALARLNAASRRERALNRELQHRVKNNLAVVQGLASQAVRSAPEPQVFYTEFSSRLLALARAQDILSSGDWSTCEFPELPQAALEAFTGRGAIQLAGPRCSVHADCCVPLVLGLHELATNSVKHGSLSVPRGAVSLAWHVRGEGARSDIVLEWIETGGPPVKVPVRRGFGSRLLVRQAGLNEVKLDFDPAGLRCTIVVSGVSPESRSGSRARYRPSGREQLS